MAKVGGDTKDKTKPKAADKPAAGSSNGTAAVKKGPSYELRKATVVQTEEGVALPPNPQRTRVASREELVNNLLTIQSTPNEWFEVVAYAARNGSDKNPSGARKVVASILGGAIKTPDVQDGAGSYDIEWRDAKYDGSDREGSVVLAMFIPAE